MRKAMTAVASAATVPERDPTTTTARRDSGEASATQTLPSRSATSTVVMASRATASPVVSAIQRFDGRDGRHVSLGKDHAESPIAMRTALMVGLPTTPDPTGVLAGTPKYGLAVWPPHSY